MQKFYVIGLSDSRHQYFVPEVVSLIAKGKIFSGGKRHHGRAIVVTIAYSQYDGIHFLQGEGVGRVTLPGLGLEVGGPAINKTPRKMIIDELTALSSKGLDVTISVPGGEEIAKKTFNQKLGVVGGISIIGTSGIVSPFSSQAFIDAIHKEVEVAVAIGTPRLVINSGAKSERIVKKLYPELPPQAFVHYGNCIGDTLKIADELNISAVTLGIMRDFQTILCHISFSSAWTNKIFHIDLTGIEIVPNTKLRMNSSMIDMAINSI